MTSAIIEAADAQAAREVIYTLKLFNKKRKINYIRVTRMLRGDKDWGIVILYKFNRKCKEFRVRITKSLKCIVYILGKNFTR